MSNGEEAAPRRGRRHERRPRSGTSAESDRRRVGNVRARRRSRDAVRSARLGAVTVKSVAAFAWTGNPPLRVAEAPGGGMLNSVGLPGPGVDAWIERDLPALEARGARVIASIWGRTVEEFAAAAAPLKAVAHRLDRGGDQSVVPERRSARRRVRAFRDRDARGDARGRRRARRFGADVRQALAQRHRHRRDRRRRARRGRDRAHVGELGDGSADRRAPARRAWARAAGVDRRADQADRAARGVGRRARTPACRSSEPAGEEAARTRSR